MWLGLKTKHTLHACTNSTLVAYLMNIAPRGIASSDQHTDMMEEMRTEAIEVIVSSVEKFQGKYDLAVSQESLFTLSHLPPPFLQVSIRPSVFCVMACISFLSLSLPLYSFLPSQPQVIALIPLASLPRQSSPSNTMTQWILRIPSAWLHLRAHPKSVICRHGACAWWLRLRKMEGWSLGDWERDCGHSEASKAQADAIGLKLLVYEALKHEVLSY